MSVDVERSEGGGAGCALLLQVCLFFLLRFVGLLSWKTDTGGKHSNTEELNQKLTRSDRTDAFADPDAVVVLTFIPLSVSPRISIRLSLRGTPRRLSTDTRNQTRTSAPTALTTGGVTPFFFFSEPTSVNLISKRGDLFDPLKTSESPSVIAGLVR